MLQALIDALYIALIAVGLSYIIVDSIIADEPRSWINSKLERIKNDFIRNKALDGFACRWCCAFHVCWVAGLIIGSPISILPAYGATVLFLDWSVKDH